MTTKFVPEARNWHKIADLLSIPVEALVAFLLDPAQVPPNDRARMKTNLERMVKNETLVRTLQADAKVTDWSKEARVHVQWGAQGRVIDRSDAHGACYHVAHEDGTTAWYAPSELRLA